MKRIWICVDSWSCIAGALLILLLPLNWLGAACLGALFHELCHLAVLMLVGGQLKGIRIGILGASLEVDFPEEWAELLSAMAGPAGSFLLAALYPCAPRLALCGFIQALANLVPIYPLDGGRILYCAAGILFPGREKQWLHMAETLFSALLFFASVWLGIRSDLGFWPVCVSGTLILRSFLRKRPCKP